MKSINIRNIILFISVTLIFLNLTIYLPFVHLFPFPAYVIDILIFTFLVLFYLKKRIYFPYQNIIWKWIVYYTMLNIIYFIFSPAGLNEVGYLKLFIFLIFVMIYLILIFNLDDNQLSFTRKTLVFLAPIASFSLMIDYFDPGYFYLGFDTGTLVAGRAASFYLNANLAGGAMLIFLIFGIDMVPKNYRILFIIVIFLGLFFTMSRSSIMVMFLLLGIMFFQKKLYGHHLLISFVGIMFFFTWLGTGGLDYFATNYDLKVTENMRTRVDFFSENSKSDTEDMNERKEVLMVALNMYAENPIFGSGYGATTFWDYKVSTHNTFAMNWADYGIFGILIIPLMFFFSSYYIFKYGTQANKQLAWLVLIYFTFSSFTSHNMLEIPLQLGTIMALSTIGYKAYQKYLITGERL